MTDEVKNVEIKTETNKCFCQSEGVKKFVTISLGTFVGAFCALSLFAALNKPPMFHPMGCPLMNGGHPMMMQMHHKHHGCDCKCHKQMMKKFNPEKFKKHLEQKKLQEKMEDKD